MRTDAAVYGGPREVSDWEIAEGLGAAWLVYLGYSDARVTAGGADGGLDVLGEDVAAQVKFKAHQVGAPAVQQLYGAGARGGSRDLHFFTGTSYSQQAIDYADATGVALWLFDWPGGVRPANEVASLALSDRARRAHTSTDGSPTREVAADVNISERTTQDARSLFELDEIAERAAAGTQTSADLAQAHAVFAAIAGREANNRLARAVTEDGAAAPSPGLAAGHESERLGRHPFPHPHGLPQVPYVPPVRVDRRSRWTVPPGVELVVALPLWVAVYLAIAAMWAAFAADTGAEVARVTLGLVVAVVVSGGLAWATGQAAAKYGRPTRWSAIGVAVGAMSSFGRGVDPVAGSPSEETQEMVGMLCALVLAVAVVATTFVASRRQHDPDE
ncbi:restriction endonuclease [Nocardioides zeae]|uniref:Restriction endonuclease n=1 Tax=Nocardioides imazamoxiresistens TaxID=3231893 RepID=A0ABU3PQY0_9ACTN|nr:restriction endonuclease [Nocardioides zeae]MDT9591613.1 restriction endonuclease [Nocardioides zeae]